MRHSEVSRETAETAVKLSLELDGSGRAERCHRKHVRSFAGFRGRRRSGVHAFAARLCHDAVGDVVRDGNSGRTEVGGSGWR